jgi:hypothetical protein
MVGAQLGRAPGPLPRASGQANMKTVRSEGTGLRASGENAHRVCHLRGATSEKTICDDRSERLRIEALARKKHEEQGDARSHWE